MSLIRSVPQRVCERPVTTFVSRLTTPTSCYLTRVRCAKRQSERFTHASVKLRAARPDKRDLLVGVMGCVAQLEGEAVFEHASSVNMVIGTRATDRIPSLIERAREGEEEFSTLTSAENTTRGTFLQSNDTHHTSLSFRSSKAATSFARSVSCLIHVDASAAVRRVRSSPKQSDFKRSGTKRFISSVRT